jgi:putative membrane protein
MVHILPHVNATLNAIAFLLLLRGFWLIRHGREQSHRRTMIGAFGVSVLFLVCYLVYHKMAGHRRLPETVQGPIRVGYLTMLASHIVLAALVPILATITIYCGITDRRDAHRRWARWTFPIWLYVSVTGVAIYGVLYWCFPLPGR